MHTIHEQQYIVVCYIYVSKVLVARVCFISIVNERLLDVNTVYINFESQALEVTAAKHKIAQLEKELREYLIWSGQGAFYEDMMSERRRIHSANIAAAKKAAEDKKFIVDLCTVGLASAVGIGVLWLIIASLVNST